MKTSISIDSGLHPVFRRARLKKRTKTTHMSIPTTAAMADADHEVTTPYATWEELTDHQRENAYEKYLDQNKLPLGDRFGMAVSKVISKSDYENYQRREKAHKAKLLTEEQFQEKCQENPEFLWDFIKAPNRPVPATIDSTQVDMHRAIDRYRQPVFGGLR